MRLLMSTIIAVTYFGIIYAFLAMSIAPALSPEPGPAVASAKVDGAS